MMIHTCLPIWTMLRTDEISGWARA